VLAASISIAGCGGSNARAVQETLLYSFAGADGSFPVCELIGDNAGNLYGTTQTGGAYNLGTVFRLAPDGTETVLHDFGKKTADGRNPVAGLLADAGGNLYGTTQDGGRAGFGTVFKLAPDGTETVLHSFGKDSGDGRYPLSALVSDSGGNLYGTTLSGGARLAGTIFRISPRGHETVLHEFGTRDGDGQAPLGGLIIDRSGTLYGTTGGGGTSDAGTVFKLAAGVETILYSFTNGDDGAGPNATLMADDAGNLYGTAQSGGKNRAGVVFMLTPEGKESVLHTFGRKLRDGRFPMAKLVADSGGNLYGTAQNGGPANNGIVFMLAPDGTETILHSFDDGNDGHNPSGGLLRDSSGRLYGVTFNGGGGADNRGTVYELTPAQ
jgi:uncharacterized repeat protein (TIGR03803 family)